MDLSYFCSFYDVGGRIHHHIQPTGYIAPAISRPRWRGDENGLQVRTVDFARQCLATPESKDDTALEGRAAKAPFTLWLSDPLTTFEGMRKSLMGMHWKNALIAAAGVSRLCLALIYPSCVHVHWFQVLGPETHCLLRDMRAPRDEIIDCVLETSESFRGRVGSTDDFTQRGGRMDCR